MTKSMGMRLWHPHGGRRELSLRLGLRKHGAAGSRLSLSADKHTVLKSDFNSFKGPFTACLAAR